MGGKRVTTESFIERAVSIHGDRYLYNFTKYNGSKENLTITCKTHGNFEQLPYNHLKGKGCMKCGLEAASKRYMYPQDKVISRFKEKHGDFYDYSMVEYSGAKNKIKIICPSHGVFEQDADAHMVGKGCDQCARQTLNYRKSDYVKKCQDKHNGKSNFYLLKMQEMDGTEFYKIGITVQKLKWRYRSKDMPYKYDVIRLIRADAEKVFDLELEIKRMMLHRTYTPVNYFAGSRYECFSHIPDEVHSMIDSLVSLGNE